MVTILSLNVSIEFLIGFKWLERESPWNVIILFDLFIINFFNFGRNLPFVMRFSFLS